MRWDCGPLLVVDDDDNFRSLLVTLLRRAGYEALEATTGAEALAAARAELPALVLLDVALPDGSGFALCRELRDALGDAVPIVLVSGARVEQLDRVVGLLLGADDYIIKPYDPDELIARIRRLLIRSAPRQAPAAPVARQSFRLTRRERDVLELLGRGASQEEMASRLFISPKTVATHIQRILVKLGVHSRAEAVAFAYRNGLVNDRPDVAVGDH
jgi:DNA-binding NarL/FixJ family response regulator